MQTKTKLILPVVLLCASGALASLGFSGADLLTDSSQAVVGVHSSPTDFKAESVVLNDPSGSTIVKTQISEPGAEGVDVAESKELAQNETIDSPPSSPESDLQAWGMVEGADDSAPVPGIQEVAMAEFAPLISTLGLSEAATGSILLPIVGGTAVAGTVAGAVSSLSKPGDQNLPPISQ